MFASICFFEILICTFFFFLIFTSFTITTYCFAAFCQNEIKYVMMMMMIIIIIIIRFRFMGHWANTAQTDHVTLRPPPRPTIGPTRLRLIMWPCDLHLDLPLGQHGSDWSGDLATSTSTYHWANTAQTDQVTLRPPPWPTIGPTRLRLIRWPCELHLDLTIGLTAGGDAVSDTDSRWLFHFPHHCGIRDLGDLLSFLTQSPTGFHDTWRHDWRWQGTESKHSGSDPADIRIRIQINPEIRIQIWGWG